jgi:hypothetical protein
MENGSFHYPVIIAKQVATDKHFADLAPLEFGIIDRKTNSVATGAGNGKEFYLSYGSPHTRDKLTKFYGGMKTPKKSENFLGKEIVSFQKALPQRPENEEWILGYGGAKDDNTLVFECGKNYEFKVKLFGEAAFGRFNKTVERIISYQTPCCDDSCSAGCDTFKLDVKEHTRKLAEKISSDVELQELQLHAQPIFSDFAATVSNSFYYSLTVVDSGDASAQFAVERAYPKTYKITRLSYVNGKSTYEVGPLASLPTAFTPTSSVTLTSCGGTCPSGFTLVGAKDVYIIARPLAGTEDFTTVNSRDTYADTIGTAYGVATDADKIFVSSNGSVANVQITVTAGTVITALLADNVVQLSSIPALCTPTAESTVAWVQSQAGYTTTRTMDVIVRSLDCTEAIPDTVTDIVASLANTPSYVAASAVDSTDVVGTGSDRDFCIKRFTITQTSNFMKDECQSPDVATFDELPSYKGFVWTVPTATPAAYDATILAGIRISAPFYSVTFGNCSFQPEEYWDNQPLRMEISTWNQSGNNCLSGSEPVGRRIKKPKYQRLFGETVLRSYIKGSGYFKFMSWENEPRIREVIDNTQLSVVKRNAYYVAYYLKFKSAKGEENFDKQGEYFEPIIYVEEGDTTTQLALENAIQAISSKWGVTLEDRI